MKQKRYPLKAEDFVPIFGYKNYLERTTSTFYEQKPSNRERMRNAANKIIILGYNASIIGFALMADGLSAKLLK